MSASASPPSAGAHPQERSDEPALGRQPSQPDQRSGAQADADRSDVVAFLLKLGALLLASGDAVSDVERRLLDAARAFREPDVRVMVLPTAVAVASGSRHPAQLATPDAGEALRLDQVTEVLGVARAAAEGRLSPVPGRERLERVRAMPSRLSPLTRAVGYVLVTLGAGLLIRPSLELLPLYVGLGACVALLSAWAARIPGMGSILPVVAATVVSAIAFVAYRAAPLQALIPPLVLFLPGALLTVATVDLASNELVAGSSRFIGGLVQLALLAIGIIAGARLVGVAPRPGPRVAPHLLGAWTPWLGVLVFGIGAALEHSAPRRSLPWLLLVLYAAWAGQLLGSTVLGPRLSGFVGGLVVAPLASLIERVPSAPPALVTFLPAFWLLVPGALGLIGFTQIVSEGPIAGATTFLDALLSVISIALGILVGLRALYIAERARASAHAMTS